MSARGRATPWFRERDEDADDRRMKVGEVYAARNRERSYAAQVCWGDWNEEAYARAVRNDDPWRGEIAFYARPGFAGFIRVSGATS